MLTSYIYKYLRYIPLDIKINDKDINFNLCLKGKQNILQKKIIFVKCVNNFSFKSA